MKFVNSDFFKNMKHKLKCIRMGTGVSLTIALGSVATLLTACSVSRPVEKPIIPPITTPSVDYDYPTLEEDDTQDDYVQPSTPVRTTALTDEEMAILKKKVRISNSDAQNFANYVHGKRVDYQYSEYFEIDEALAKYNGIKEYETVSSNFIKNGKIDENGLKIQVMKNNEEYLKNQKGNRYSALSTSDFDNIFKSLMEGLNYQLDSNVDLAQLDDNLTNLKILAMSASGSAMVTDDAILAVNMKVIQIKQNSYPNVNYLRMTIIHEAQHLKQVSSVQEREKEGYTRNLGIAYSWDDLKVDSLFWQWFLEGAAQALTDEYERLQIIPTYESQVKAIQSLTLSTILKDEVGSITVPKISLQPNLNQLFEIFNCKTDEDRKEIVKMMFAYEISLNQNSKFANYYKSKTNTALNNYTYSDSLRASVGGTLTKVFYENLSTSIVDKDISLEDIFSITAAFETEMARVTRYSSATYQDAHVAFAQHYNDIQSQFFTLLGKSLDMKAEDVYALYNGYFHDNLSDTMNSSLLDSEELSYVNDILQSRLSNKQKTVNEATGYKIS